MAISPWPLAVYEGCVCQNKRALPGERQRIWRILDATTGVGPPMTTVASTETPAEANDSELNMTGQTQLFVSAIFMPFCAARGLARQQRKRLPSCAGDRMRFPPSEPVDDENERVV